MTIVFELASIVKLARYPARGPGNDPFRHSCPDQANPLEKALNAVPLPVPESTSPGVVRRSRFGTDLP